MKQRIVKERALTNTTMLLSEKQAAEHLDRAEGTLRNWRTKKGSNVLIPHVRNNSKSVFYKLEDILAIAESKSIKRTEKLHKFPRIDILFSDSSIPDLDPSTILTTAEAALAFGISKASLQIWRSKRQFIGVLPFHGTCQDIRYHASELAHFIREGRAYWSALSAERNRQYRPRTKLSA
ncbi:helix-turn-helix domain-containing protein [Pseudomonas guariconensis]|uniref:helix-turn-helix domain-containing protein n=1 Tax=Pseudomonas guariconensis TaxID=1288410 RepID=UPI0018AA0E94|nr:helix-turn-helix domain-containing protein [Pseudomonas guariconensis]MBF8755489.1 helix-turn-helix domain-containing protein [Pseudomonas guariconensis]